MKISNAYLLHLADSALIISHRNSEWTGHGPVLEQDIALTNIALDQLGLARLLYQEVAGRIGDTDEDKLAYLRTEREYSNLLLTELPNGDWGQTTLKLYFYSQFMQLLLEHLQSNNDMALAAIAEKTLKEVKYHVRWSSEWVIRLSDGTDESHERMLKALENLWPYSGEMFAAADYETEIGIDLGAMQKLWLEKVQAVLEEATLPMPAKTFMHMGGKQGVHTEHLGYLLAEMQYMQRAYPNSEW